MHSHHLESIMERRFDSNHLENHELDRSDHSRHKTKLLMTRIKSGIRGATRKDCAEDEKLRRASKERDILMSGHYYCDDCCCCCRLPLMIERSMCSMLLCCPKIRHRFYE